MLMNIVKEYGFVPEIVFGGYTTADKGHNHSLLDTSLKRTIEKINYFAKFTFYSDRFKDTLKHYLGAIPDSFTDNNKTINGKEFRSKYKIVPQNYITITSFSHHNYFEWFVLEDKFNWASELYYNVPWNIFETICDSALLKGYSFVWDGDVTESGFNYQKGYATISFKKNTIENERLFRFFSHDTKIDHVMHIVGLLKKDGEFVLCCKELLGKNRTIQWLYSYIKRVF
jgi:bleomycin hydrolase